MLLAHGAILEYIFTSNDVIAVWGASLTTKKFLYENHELSKKIDFIIENNVAFHGKVFMDKEVVSPDILLQDKKILIVLWGNHIEEIVKQLQKYKISNFIIDYEYSKNYIPQQLIFKLDYLKQNQDPNDHNFSFCDAVIEYCIENTLECHIKPYKWLWQSSEAPEKIVKKYLLFNSTNSKNTIFMSYHTIGDSYSHIFRWKEGYLYNTITFDSTGYSGWNSLCSDNIHDFKIDVSPEKLQKHLENLQNKYIHNNLSKYQQNRSNFEFPQKFIFFPLQTFNDTVVLHSYFDPFQLLHDIVEILHKKNIPLVIKQHPRCHNYELQKLLLEYQKQNKIILFDGSIHDAISRASTVYAINSGVGFESLLHLKPVVTFGKSDYMQVTKNINSFTELKKNPFYTLSTKEKEDIKQFLYYYMHHKCLEINDKVNIKKTIHSFVINYLNKEHYANTKR
jgi:hypothetical protein